MAATSAVPGRLNASSPLQSALDRFFSASLFSLVVVGFLALAGTGKLDALSLFGVLTAFGVRTYQFLTLKDWHLSVQITSRLTIFYFVFGVFDFFFISGEFVRTLVHLVLFAMVVMLFSLQTPRYNFYLALIAFMMLLSAAIMTVDGIFLLAFCIFLLLAASTFISMEMKRSLTASQSGEGNAVAMDMDASSPHRLVRSLSKASAWIVACTTVGAAAMFFLLPRATAGYLSAYTQKNDFVTGFSDEVRLGAIGRIKQSNSVVMRVHFNSTEVPKDMLWRGKAFSVFNGVTWTNHPAFISTRSGPDGKVNLQEARFSKFFAGVKRDHPPAPNHVVGYEVLMEPIGTNTFFLLPMPLAVNSSVRDYWVFRSGYIVSSDPSLSLNRYVGNSDPAKPTLEQQNSIDENYPSDLESEYLKLPSSVDPRISTLAHDVTRKSTSVYQRASTLESFLRTKFGYSLDMDTPPGRDPLAYFLFDRKIGHCEYFAYSMAVMLRTLGIPSRIINGFHGGEYNDVTGSYIIRARDAHSWVEAYIPGFGWTTFDPTPASDDATTHTGWERIALYADAVREFWREWVVNYDFSHQENLARSSASQARQNFDHFRIWAKEKYEQLLAAARLTKEAAAGQPRAFVLRAGLLALFLLAVFNLKKWIAYYQASRLASTPSRAPRTAATIWYQRLLRFLARRGFERTPGQTPQEFIISIEEPAIRSKVNDFIRHYERARFGASADDADRLPALYTQIETAIKQ